MYEFDAYGVNDKGRSSTRWLDGVKRPCDARLQKLRDEMLK